jgi:hypothetical protein
MQWEILCSIGLAAAMVAGSDSADQSRASRASAQPPFKVQFPHGPTRTWVEAAVEGAARRLSDSRCQEVLGDFADAEGRTLTAVLATLRQTPSQYLREVWFVDGRHQSQCENLGIDAFTIVGGRVILLCPRLFRRQLGSMHNDILIIHELLHTLGLGENPPTSAQITEQITKRCR